MFAAKKKHNTLNCAKQSISEEARVFGHFPPEKVPIFVRKFPFFWEKNLVPNKSLCFFAEKFMLNNMSFFNTCHPWGWYLLFESTLRNISLSVACNFHCWKLFQISPFSHTTHGSNCGRSGPQSWFSSRPGQPRHLVLLSHHHYPGIRTSLPVTLATLHFAILQNGLVVQTPKQGNSEINRDSSTPSSFGLAWPLGRSIGSLTRRSPRVFD